METSYGPSLDGPWSALERLHCKDVSVEWSAIECGSPGQLRWAQGREDRGDIEIKRCSVRDQCVARRIHKCLNPNKHTHFRSNPKRFKLSGIWSLHSKSRSQIIPLPL